MKILYKQSLVYIVIGLVIFCSTCIVTWFSLSNMLYKNKLETLESFANVALNEIDLFFFEKECGLKTLSSCPLFKSSLSKRNITERLIQFRNLNKSYLSISYFDMNRIRIADTAGLCIGKKDPKHSFWKDIKEGKVSIGSCFEYSSSLKRNVIYLAVPVIGHDDKLKGAIVARLPNEFINNIINTALKVSTFSENLLIDLCSSNGLIIFSNHNPKSILKEKAHDFNYIYNKLKKDRNNGLINTDKYLADGKYIGFYAKEKGYLTFKGNDWILVLHYPIECIYTPLYSLMRSWFFLMIPCLIIAVLICLYLAKKFSIPLKILSAKVIDFGNGKLSVRADIKTKDEIGNLAETFNKMADKLEKTTTSIVNLEKEIDVRKKIEEQLQSQKKFTDNVLKTTQAIIVVLDNNGNIEYFNPYLEMISGYELSELKGKSWIATFLPEREQEKVKEVLNNSLNGIDAKGNINPILTKNQELRYIEWYDSKIRDNNGNVKELVAVGIDITEKIANEENLRLFKDLVNSSNDPIYLIDTEDSKFIDINDIACSTLDYDRKELLQLGVIDVDTTVTDLSAWNSFMKEVRCRKEMVVESKHRKKNGEIFPVEVSLRLRDYSNKKYMVAVARDITKRKETEMLLLKEKTYSENLIKALPDGFLVHDVNGRILDINHNLEKIIGFTKDETIGKNILDFIPENQVELLKTTVRTALSNKAVTVEHIINKKNGELLNILVTSSPFKDINDKVIGALAVIRDITEKKEIEKKLSDSEELYRLTLSNVFDTVILTDDNGEIKFVCPNSTFITGFSDDEIHSMGNIAKLIGNIEIDKILLKNKGLVKDIECKIISKEGKKHDLLITIRSIDIINSTRLYTFHDITELKKAEVVLLRDQRIKSIGEVSAGIAHDFNNTLQRILAGTETLLADNSLTESSSYTLSRIKESAELSAERVRQLLLFSGQSGIKKEKTTFELVKVINSTIQQVEPIIRKINHTKNIKINIYFKCLQKIYIKGFIGEFQDVLFNLFKNSFDAMPEGGKIVISLKIKEAKVKLNFSDTGIGMDMETAVRAFEPFYTTKKIGEGTGVGLSSAYGIIKSMNGEICIKNTQINSGTEFEIILPLESKRDVKAKAEDKIIENIIAKVLWVEDDKDIREMGKTLLKLIGHQAVVAESGKEALRILKKQKVDIMITDIGMPDMTGWELIDKVNNLYPKTNIVVLSGWNNDLSENELKERKIDNIIQKPINKKQLDELIRDIMKFKNC